ERREELVFGEHGGAGERVQERALARVRVADDGHRRHPLAGALAPPLLALLGELFELPLEVRHAFLGAAAPDLEFGLAGTATADASGQARERVVLHREARQAVLQLCELDLELAVFALGALREDVE